MQPDVLLEMQILCAVGQHQGPRPFGHADLMGLVGDDGYVEATRRVKHHYARARAVQRKLTDEAGAYV